MSDRPNVDQLLSKAREFTDIEDTTLDAWLRAENLNLNELAARILDAGLMAEHFNSLLEADVNKRTPQEQQALLSLRNKLEESLNELSEQQDKK